MQFFSHFMFKTTLHSLVLLEYIYLDRKLMRTTISFLNMVSDAMVACKLLISFCCCFCCMYMVLLLLFCGIFFSFKSRKIIIKLAKVQLLHYLHTNMDLYTSFCLFKCVYVCVDAVTHSLLLRIFCLLSALNFF